jgi:hypothetical protein
MDYVSENIGNAVALLTAIISEQEDLAYEMVLESDPIELFSTLTGLLLSFIKRLAEINGVTVETYLRDLGMSAFKP